MARVVAGLSGRVAAARIDAGVCHAAGGAFLAFGLLSAPACSGNDRPADA